MQVGSSWQLVIAGVEAWGYCGAAFESLGGIRAARKIPFWLFSARMASDTCADALLLKAVCSFACRVGACCVMAVVDYDVVRADAARAAEEKVGVVRGLVSKLGKAQRAAEATLDMCHKRCAGK